MPSLNSPLKFKITKFVKISLKKTIRGKKALKMHCQEVKMNIYVSLSF